MPTPEPGATPVRQAWLAIQGYHASHALPPFCCSYTAFEEFVGRLLKGDLKTPTFAESESTSNNAAQAPGDLTSKAQAGKATNPREQPASLQSAGTATSDRQCLRAMTDGRCSAPNCMCPMLPAQNADDAEFEMREHREARATQSATTSITPDGGVAHDPQSGAPYQYKT